MADDAQTDRELVSRLRVGDADALRALYTRHAASVFGAAVRLVDAAQADDIVQEVFLQLWKKSDAYDPEHGALRPWLVTLAKNRARNELRRTRTHVADAELDAVPTGEPEPDEQQWSAHRRAVVRQALDRLPEDQRRALSLAFLDDLTNHEVAEVLGTPLGTAKTRIRGGLKRLAVLLAAAVAVTSIVLVWRRAEREERALAMVTSSDVIPRRLDAVNGIPAEAHGQYRSRPGAKTVVLTTTKLPKLANGEHYEAWARTGDIWTKLGEIHAGGEDRTMLVAESDALAQAPDELKVTRAGELVLSYRANP